MEKSEQEEKNLTLFVCSSLYKPWHVFSFYAVQDVVNKLNSTNHHPTVDEISRSFPLTTVSSALCQLSQQNHLKNKQNQNKLCPLNLP